MKRELMCIKVESSEYIVSWRCYKCNHHDQHDHHEQHEIAFYSSGHTINHVHRERDRNRRARSKSILRFPSCSNKITTQITGLETSLWTVFPCQCCPKWLTFPPFCLLLAVGHTKKDNGERELEWNSRKDTSHTKMNVDNDRVIKLVLVC